jgi:hypothetical protein
MSFVEFLKDPKNNPFFYDIQNTDFKLPSLDQYPPTELKYLTADLFTSYLTLIINSYINVNTNTITKNIRDDFLEINFESLDFRIANSLYSAIHNNITTISILPIRLVFPFPSKTNHSNVIIINPMLQTIEFFEPHGIELGSVLENVMDTTSLIKKIFYNIFPEFNIFTFVNSSQNCTMGVQALQGIADNNVGHCLAWSLLFIQLRLYYINNTSDYIVTSLSKINPISLDYYIKQYISLLNSLNLEKKNPLPVRKQSFRSLLSSAEIDIETEYLKNLISLYWNTLQEKIDLIDNDASLNHCDYCFKIGINDNHKFSQCCFNQGMLTLNEKLSKLLKSIYGYRNTPNFDESFHHESVDYFFKDIKTPTSFLSE